VQFKKKIKKCEPDGTPHPVHPGNNLGRHPV